MRERTAFPRKVIEALPDLKLLITTGAKNNSFDIKAAAEHGVTVCGTGAVGNPTTGIAFGLMLELTRRIGFENARLKAGAPWQVTIGQDLEGLTLGDIEDKAIDAHNPPSGVKLALRHFLQPWPAS